MRVDLAGVTQLSDLSITQSTTDAIISRNGTQLAIIKNTAIANLTATNVVFGTTAPNNPTVNVAPAIAPVTFSINENSAVDTLVGKVTATDDNLAAGDKLKFSITGGNNDLNANGVAPFSIDPITGEIKVTDRGDLDFERNASINVRVRVSDADNLFNEAQVTVALNDVAEATPLPFKLTNFEFDNRPKLGTTSKGDDILLGGLSGLFFVGTAANGNLKFVANTDRGPNGNPTGQNRPFLLPDFQPEIVSFELNRTTGKIEITKRTGLFRADGVTKLTGLPNLQAGAGGTAYTDEVGVDLDNNVLNNDPLGADLEGIVIDASGNYWLVDEYRPAIYQFDVNGKLLDRFIPIGTAAAPNPDAAAGTFGTEVLPAVYAQRRNNRGFEAVAIEGNKLYAFIQSAIDNPDVTNDSTSSNSRNLRILEFDIVTKAVTAEYLYILDNVTGAGTAKTDKIGDAVSLGNGKFAVVERDDRSTTESNKLIYEIDLKNATNINNSANLAALPTGKTIEQLSPAELLAANIKSVNKTLIANAAKFGYTGVEKLEGLALIAPNAYALINDNDFSTDVPVKLGILETPLQLTNNNGTITIGGGGSNRPTISFSIKGVGAGLVSELGLFIVDDDAGTIDGSSPDDDDYAEKALGRAKVIFSVISNNPNGFTAEGLERILGFDVSTKFRFFSINDRTTTTDLILKSKSFEKVTFSSVTSLNFQELTTTSFSISFNNLVINAQAGTESIALGTGLQDNREGEVIDLRSGFDATLFPKVEATFTLNREAAFNNFIGFYKVENAAGDIRRSDGSIVKVGSSGYTQAAISSRVAGIDLTVDNQTTRATTGIFEAGSIFAPFIVVNGNPSAILDNNPNNDPAVYFSYLGANSDGIDHVRLLGNNTFGFEDLPRGGDFDYNDIIVNIKLKPIA
ncbi:MAG: calcium-binding protein [Pseudanabaena sp.]|nr:MAG: calcium-binding protein [Pseudanabaena sp.]